MVWGILTAAERRRLLLLLPAVIAAAVLDAVGLASLLPFLSLLSRPGLVEEHPSARWAFAAGGFASREGFLLAATGALLGVVALSNSAAALSLWGVLRTSFRWSHSIATRLLAEYLRKPYAFFLGRNSTDLAKNLVFEVQSVVSGILVQGLSLAARGTSALFVISTLFFLDPEVATCVMLGAGLLYGLLFRIARDRVSRGGMVSVEANRTRLRLAAETLAGVKEVKLYGMERTAVERFARPSLEYARQQGDMALFSQLPRLALETIGVAAIMGVVAWFLLGGRDLSHALPSIGLCVVAAHKSLPGLQLLFQSFVSFRFYWPAFEEFARDLQGPESPPAPGESVAFRGEVVLEGVSFQYDPARLPALSQVSARVARGEWLAIVGPTGSGKSTLLEVLLGLLWPTSGRVLIDGEELSPSRVRAWQAQVGYVPQQVFLMDDSIEQNVCYSLGASEVDQERLRDACRLAQLERFIESELPARYGTRIGERGVALSGGQRQRLGIARALYRSPHVLALDEATSALDLDTERSVLEGLRATLQGTTVVAVTHRLASTRLFDRVLVLEGGRLVDEGTFEQLRSRNPSFGA